MSIMESYLPRILEMAGKLSGEEIAEELDISVGRLRDYCSSQGISLARSLEARRKYNLIPCLNHARCGNMVRSTGKHHRCCERCRQGRLTVFDIEQRGRP